jgi:hypothetical protein
MELEDDGHCIWINFLKAKNDQYDTSRTRCLVENDTIVNLSMRLLQTVQFQIQQGKRQHFEAELRDPADKKRLASGRQAYC